MQMAAPVATPSYAPGGGAGTRRACSGEARLRIQRRQQGPQGPAGRQGRQPCRDDQHRPARAAWLHYHHRGVPEGLAAEVSEHLARMEQAMGRQLGDPADPLLVSVRSGAKFSMPGMMDTVLNIGLSDESVGGLARQSGSERFAWDSYRRLIQMFGKTVLGIDGEAFEHAIEETKRAKGTKNDLDLDAGDLHGIVETFKELVQVHASREFPQDPREQMDLAVLAVFRSWNADRAILYRRQERIPADLGTAVNI